MSAPTPVAYHISFHGEFIGAVFSTEAAAEIELRRRNALYPGDSNLRKVAPLYAAPVAAPVAMPASREHALRTAVDYLMKATNGSRSPVGFIESVSDLFDRLIDLTEDDAGMTLEEAMHYAKCWRDNKLLGGDPYEVSKALLSEVERQRKPDSGRDATLMALDPRQWTLEMSTAWHRAIPNLPAAFAALREAADVAPAKTDSLLPTTNQEGA